MVIFLQSQTKQYVESIFSDILLLNNKLVTDKSYECICEIHVIDNNVLGIPKSIIYTIFVVLFTSNKVILFVILKEKKH